MKVGIAVSTYANEKTNDQRFIIIKKCLDSLLTTDITVVIVNDGSNNQKHLDLINSYDTFIMIHRKENGGIAKCKNTAIKYFDDNDFDICFLMDDDVEILNKDFYKFYIDAHEKTGIDHFCLQVGSLHKISNVTENGISYKISNHTNGCFLMITKKMIKELGYFKILPFKYGHEHSNYSTRAKLHHFAPGYVDISNSNELLKLIDNSLIIDAGARIYGEDFDKNEYVAFYNIKNEKYIECIE